MSAPCDVGGRIGCLALGNAVPKIYAREAEQEHKAPITVETWVRERQRHIFSSQQQARYKQLVTSDASEGAEKKELETDVAGIRVKYWN